jgi:hypothetical protein
MVAALMASDNIENYELAKAALLEGKKIRLAKEAAEEKAAEPEQPIDNSWYARQKREQDNRIASIQARLDAARGEG